MTAGFELDAQPDALGETAEVLRRAADDLRGALDAFAAKSTTLTAAWTGEAAAAYSASYADFAQKARAQVAVLDAAGRALGDLARAYGATDEGGARTVPH